MSGRKWVYRMVNDNGYTRKANLGNGEVNKNGERMVNDNGNRGKAD